MLFKGRNQIPFDYSCYGWTRYGGTKFHGGVDIVGLDDPTIYFPTFKGKSITGTVVQATMVPEASGYRTWEWGWYVCVMINENQTGDPINYLYFCHNERNIVKVGQTVKSGDPIAIMGNTGNAAKATPPIKHVHFEARIKTNGTGQDPSDFSMIPNKEGIYYSEPTPEPSILHYGVDISEHQTQNAMSQIVSNGKAEFVIFRGSIGDSHIDEHFDGFYADKGDLKLGYYMANYFTTPDNARKEVDFLINYLENIGIPEPDLPIFVDWEGFSYTYFVKKMGYNPSNDLIREMTSAAISQIRQRGYTPGIYLNRDYYNNKYGTSYMQGLKDAGVWIWLADPSNPMTPLIDCDIHQYEVADGADYGYPGEDLDKNKLYRSYLTDEKPEVFDKVLLKSFGSKNMQGFGTTNVDTPVLYDRMPNGYRICTKTGIAGSPNNSWEWVEFIDERDGKKLYTPIISDRNQIVNDVPTLVPDISGGGEEEIAKLEERVTVLEKQVDDANETISKREDLINSIHEQSDLKEDTNE